MKTTSKIFCLSLLSLYLAMSMAAQVVTGGGGTGGGLTPNTPSPANYFSVKNYGAVGDCQRVTDGIVAGSSNTVTSATAAFCNAGSLPCPAGRTSDVGKKITCVKGASGTIWMPLSTITSVTATIATTNGTDAGANNGLSCLWFTQDETTKFQAANTASLNPSSNDPNGWMLQPYPGTVYCPAGGYAVNGRIFSAIGTGNSMGPSFIGEGRDKCVLYVLPTIIDPNDGFAVVMNFYSYIGPTVSNFTLDGSGFNFGFSHPFIQLYGDTQFLVENVTVRSASFSSAVGSSLDFKNGSNGIVRNMFVQGSGGSNDFACDFDGMSSVVVQNITCSNHNQNLRINNTGNRSVFGDNGIVFDGGLVDECGTGITNCAVLTNNSIGSFYGTTFLQGSSTSNYALSVDGTSRAFLSNVSCGVYGSIATQSNCMTIASGGYVSATNSDFRGNDSNSTVGVAVNGPVGATFVDLGANKIRHSVSSVITDVTPAQYATLGFTGGIVPKSTQTHTPNTCYVSITPIANATTYTACNMLMDQNYQILNITASSQVTTTCATAPIVTISDGTQTATLTLTTAKNAWTSTVDTHAGINNIFASGNTMTVKYDVAAASACATPPTNLAISYVLQSVLNP